MRFEDAGITPQAATIPMRFACYNLVAACHKVQHEVAAYAHACRQHMQQTVNVPAQHSAAVSVLPHLVAHRYKPSGFLP